MISEDSTQSTYGIFSEQTKESTPGKTTGKITEFTPVIITEKITDSTPGIIKQTTESTNKTENVSANQNDDLDITIETVTTKVSKSHDEDLDITMETATTKVSTGDDEDLDITMETATTKVSTGHDEDLDITMKTATTKVSKSNIISLTTKHEKETMESDGDITETPNLSMSTGQIILDSTTNQQLDLISTLPGIKGKNLDEHFNSNKSLPLKTPTNLKLIAISNNFITDLIPSSNVLALKMFKKVSGF
jgi:AAA15 family ATPase/GTPase